MQSQHIFIEKVQFKKETDSLQILFHVVILFSILNKEKMTIKLFFEVAINPLDLN